MKSRNNLDSIVSMLGLEEKRIKILVKDVTSMKKLGRLAAGKYHPIWNEIRILEDVIPYWFATLVTVLHESRHYKQRSLILATLTLGGLGSFISWLYGIQVYDYLYIYGFPVVFMIGIVLAWLYFEYDAGRYEVKYLEDIHIILAILDILMLIQSLGAKQKAICHYLSTLQKVMTTRSPNLLK